MAKRENAIILAAQRSDGWWPHPIKHVDQIVGSCFLFVCV